MDFGYRSITGAPPSLDLLAKAPVLSFDVEATGTSITDMPLGVSVIAGPGTAYWFPIDHQMIEILAPKFVVAFNAKYDRSMLKKVGVNISENLIDPMIAAHLLTGQRLRLKFLASEKLGLDIKTYEDIGKTFDGMTVNDMAEFSGAHSIATLLLWRILREELARFRMTDIFHTIEMPLIPVLSDMELDGVAVDINILHSLGVEFSRKIDTVKEALDHYAGIKVNYNSPQQLAHLLFDVLKLPPGRMTIKTNRPSTDAEVLEGLKGKSPVIRLILLYRGYQSLIGTYVEGLSKQIVDGRVHGSFNQAGTRTGRLSSDNPNLQNIPERKAEGRRIRTAFVAPTGYVLVKADANQIELRVMAHCSQDRAMLDAYALGKDIHEETAVRAYGSKKFRKQAKTLNYQIVYGGGDYGSRKKFYSGYPGIGKWTKSTQKQAIEDGYVRTLGGRIRVIPELASDNQWMRRHGLNEAVSTIIQGSTAEVIKQSMVRAHSALQGSGVKLVLQVHDEMVYEVPVRELEDVISILREVLPCCELSVPIPFDIEVGSSWGTMTPVERRLQPSGT